MPKLYLSPAQQPNAFATGRNPSHAVVAVTEGLLRVLEPDEVRGVLAHEMSHVKNRDILIGSVAAAMAMGITFIARMAMWGAMFSGRGGGDRDNNVFGVLAMAILAPVAAMMIQMAISRSREFEADRAGAALLGGDGEALARALEKIEASAEQVPMNIDPAQATAYIINPLTGRKANFSNWSGIPKSCSLSFAITFWRSSRFLAVTRSCSPWTWCWTPFIPSALMYLPISRALSELMPTARPTVWRTAPFDASSILP